MKELHGWSESALCIYVLPNEFVEGLSNNKDAYYNLKFVHLKNNSIMQLSNKRCGKENWYSFLLEHEKVCSSLEHFFLII